MKKKLKPILAIKGARSFPKLAQMPKFDPPAMQGIHETVDPLFARIHKTLGGASKDVSLTKRVITLMGSNPQGTLPELVTMDWLNANQYPYEFQAQVWGGRSRRGGMLPDFVIFTGGYAIAWLVQGEWHHSASGQATRNQTGRDMFARLRLMGAMVNGVRIEMVVELWEQDIYKQRPEIFIHAMSGISIRFGN